MKPQQQQRAPEPPKATGPEITHTYQLTCERAGLQFRVRYTGEDGQERVTEWREYGSALIADAHELWRKWWEQAFLRYLGTYRP